MSTRRALQNRLFGLLETTVTDHGWVISAVYDAVAKTTFLVLLDAEDMNSGPICTIDLKRHLPYGFHGSWKMPKEAQLKQNMTCNSLAKL